MFLMIKNFSHHRRLGVWQMFVVIGPGPKSELMFQEPYRISLEFQFAIKAHTHGASPIHDLILLFISLTGGVYVGGVIISLTSEKR